MKGTMVKAILSPHYHPPLHVIIVHHHRKHAIEVGDTILVAVGDEGEHTAYRLVNQSHVEKRDEPPPQASLSTPAMSQSIQSEALDHEGSVPSTSPRRKRFALSGRRSVIGFSKSEKRRSPGFVLDWVAPAVGIIKPGTAAEISIHHDDTHTSDDEGSDGTHDRLAILSVVIRGTQSTAKRSHQCHVHNRYSPKNTIHHEPSTKGHSSKKYQSSHHRSSAKHYDKFDDHHRSRHEH